MQLLAQQIRDAKRYQDEALSISAEMSDIHKKMEGIQNEIDDYVKKRNLWARMIPLFLVVAAIVVYPFYGMVTHMASPEPRSVTAAVDRDRAWGVDVGGLLGLPGSATWPPARYRPPVFVVPRAEPALQLRLLQP